MPSERSGTPPSRPSQRASTIPFRRRLAALLITLFGILLVGFAFLEILFRTFVPVTDVPLSFWDPLVGPRLQPNQAGRFIKGSYDAKYNINSQGWNHPADYRVERSPGTVRIALVGDSQVESLQVNVEDTMFAVAQRRMSRPSRPVQWYAFGKAGFGTAQELEVIRKYVLDYRPDVVVLLFVQNDPFDCSPYLVDPGPNIPIYSLDASGDLAFHFPVGPYQPNPWRRLAARSAVVRYFIVQKDLLYRIQAFRGGPSGRPDVGGLPLVEPTSGAGGWIAELAALPMEERERRTWQLIEALLKEMRDESRHRGARFAVAFRGWPEEIDSPLTGALPPLPPAAEDPSCLRSRIRQMGPEILEPMTRRLGIAYLDLAVPLKSAVARSRKSHRFPEDNHYCVFGHAAAGEALAGFVDSILADSSLPPAASTLNHHDPSVATRK